MAAVLVGAVLSGCDLMIAGTVPPYLTYATAELDLTGTLPASIREVQLEVVPAGPENESVFVLVVRPDQAGPDTMVMVDSRVAVPRVRQDSTDVTRFDTRPFRRTDGGVQVGNLVYDPVVRTLANAPRIEGRFRPTLLKDLDGEYFFMELASPTSLRILPYDASFISSGGEDILPVAALGLTDPIEHFEARMFGPLEVDLVLVDDQRWFWFATIIPGVGVEREAFPLDLDFDVDTVSIQRTDRGIIGRTYEGELVRLDRETGVVLDRFNPTGTDRRRDEVDIIFDPGGRFYVLFDRQRKILYRVASWW